MAAGFYVTMIRGEHHRRVSFLAGPYAEHAEALRAVAPAKALAQKLDPWADFDAFGTASLDPPVRLGVFNHLVSTGRKL